MLIAAAIHELSQSVETLLVLPRTFLVCFFLGGERDDVHSYGGSITCCIVFCLKVDFLPKVLSPEEM